MPVTQVSVCNSALVKVGADRISSITQNTKSAILLNAIFNQTRDNVLRAHPWNFAMKRATLAPTSTTPEFEWDYQYDKPSDMLRVWETYPDDIPHIIEGEKILTDESSLDVRYIYRQDDPATWDACFAEALAWNLAEQIALALTGSLNIQKACADGYKRALAEARSMDGMEGAIKGLEIDDWILARGR